MKNLGSLKKNHSIGLISLYELELVYYVIVIVDDIDFTTSNSTINTSLSSTSIHLETAASYMHALQFDDCSIAKYGIHWQYCR